MLGQGLGAYYRAHLKPDTTSCFLKQPRNMFTAPAEGCANHLNSLAAQNICLPGSKVILQRLLPAILQIHSAIHQDSSRLLLSKWVFCLSPAYHHCFQLDLKSLTGTADNSIIPKEQL